MVSSILSVDIIAKVANSGLRVIGAAGACYADVEKDECIACPTTRDVTISSVKSKHFLSCICIDVSKRLRGNL